MSNKYRDIRIAIVANGYMLRVGPPHDMGYVYDQDTYVFEDEEEMGMWIRDFYIDCRRAIKNEQG